MFRPTHVEVDLNAIRANVRAIRKHIGPKVKMMPAVKANGYGHGSIQVSRAALEAGADMLSVATVEEAQELRGAGIEAPILTLGCVPPEAAEVIVKSRISTTICDLSFAKILSNAAQKLGEKARVHIKLDTGMGRIGITPDLSLHFAEALFAMPGIEVEGIFTHFPTSDEADGEFTKLQIKTFADTVSALEAKGFRIPCKHTANSGAILAHPESYFDMVRPGIMFYGYYPSEDVPKNILLVPALTLKTKIVYLKEVPAGTSISYGRRFIANRPTRVATIPIGYADGYNRHLSNRGQALINGQIAPVIGTVCMDQTMLDVTDIPGVVCGDEVILYGGNGPVSVDQVAIKLETISYEVLCAISVRVPRVYIGQ